jgi:nucleoside-diphosphate-sugar epimerase
VTRRVAVTGANGFIGRHVVAMLRERGDAAYPIARPFEAVRIASQIAGADAVIHLAGLVSAASESAFVDANVEGTRTVATAARAAGVPIVFVSSLAAGGPAPADRPRVETDPPAPLTAYGRSKLAGERAIRAIDGLRWTILRPTVVYGPGDRGMYPVFRLAARGILPHVGRRTAKYMFVHVRDLTRVIDRAIDARAFGETMFVCHPHAVTTRTLLDRLSEAVGRQAPIVRVPDVVLWAASRVGDVVGALRGKRLIIDSPRYAELSAPGFVCSVDRLRDRLGIVAEIDLDEGLAQTAAWYRAEGWL